MPFLECVETLHGEIVLGVPGAIVRKRRIGPQAALLKIGKWSADLLDKFGNTYGS